MGLTPRQKLALHRLRFAGADKTATAVTLDTLPGVDDDTMWSLWRLGCVEWVQWDMTVDPRRWYLRKRGQHLIGK